MVLHVYRRQERTVFACFEQACQTRDNLTLSPPSPHKKVKNGHWKDRHQITCSLSKDVSMNSGTVHAIIQDVDYHKVHSQWVTQARMHTHKWTSQLHHLQPYHTHDAFQGQTMVGQYDMVSPLCTQRKMSRHEMETPTQPQLKKFRSSICWYSNDIKWPPLLDFRSYGVITSTNHYCQNLWNLCTNIKNKHPSKLTDSIVLLHECVCPHVVQSLGPTIGHAMWSAWTSFIQPRIIAMWLSLPWTVKESAQRLKIMPHYHVQKAVE